MRGRAPIASLAGLALAAAVVLLAVWLPLILNFRVETPAVDARVVEASRTSPPDEVLEEMRRVTYGIPDVYAWPAERLTRTARSILAGEFRWQGGADAGARFDPARIASGPPLAQLDYCAFIVPRILLADYERNGSADSLAAAERFVLDWIRHERKALLPRGFIWNDHAIACRVITLANLWRIERHRPEFPEADAVALLEAVGRTGQLLAKHGEYTFATNHGSMQNLGLLLTGVAFPAVPGADEFALLGHARFEEQIEYHVSEEGPVLEHSAYYHRSGFELTAYALRFGTLLSFPVREKDWTKYAGARQFYEMLRRPGGLLPRLGDTTPEPDEPGPVVVERLADGGAGPLHRPEAWSRPTSSRVYPAAGFMVAWEGDQAVPSQTTVTWSYYPGHGHKHADELSVLLWRGGRSWWTNVGYWPYDHPDRERAESWEGSNAPFFAGEGRFSRRESKLLGFAAGPAGDMVDMARTAPGRGSLRRQVLLLRPAVWVVVDSMEADAPERMRSFWRPGQGLELDRLDGGAGRFRLRDPDDPAALCLEAVGSDGFSVEVGPDDASAGLDFIAEQGKQLVRVPLLRMEGRGKRAWNAVVAAASERCPPDGLRDTQMAWNGPEQWRLQLRLLGGTVSVERNRDRVEVRGPAETARSGLGLLHPTPRDLLPRVRSRQAFAAARGRYDARVVQALLWRWRVTYLLAGAALLQELFFALVRRKARGWSTPLRWFSAGAWILLGAWIAFFYFSK